MEARVVVAEVGVTFSIQNPLRATQGACSWCVLRRQMDENWREASSTHLFLRLADRRSTKILLAKALTFPCRTRHTWKHIGRGENVVFSTTWQTGEAWFVFVRHDS